MSRLNVNIVRARHLGMCFGVRDAIALAFTHGEARPLTILGDLVHNATVSAALQAKGIAVAHDLADVRTHTVMITAHGASARRVETTRAPGRRGRAAAAGASTVRHRGADHAID